MRIRPVSWLVCLGIVGPASFAHGLAPRAPLPKEPLVAHDAVEERLVVKFADALAVRAGRDGMLTATAPGANLAHVTAVAARHDLHFEPLIALPEAALRFMEERAEARSGVGQPDLAGIVIVHAPAGSPLVEIAESFQALDEVEFVCFQALGEPPPTDIAPATPNLVPNQTYRPPNPGMDVDFAWSAGATGAGVRLSDCEYGWAPTHEDFNEIALHLEPGQTVHPSVFVNGWEQHGTAVLGETSSMANAYGCSGMVPDAAVYTWPEWTVEGGFRRATCIANAIASSAVGGIIVGAGSSTLLHGKLGFSTYGTRVNVQGWGQNVFTLGYGDFAQYGGDPNQRYTQSFSGTSSASPFVASACVALQSVALAITGIPLTPLEMRQLLIDTGRAQGGPGGHIGPFPDLRAAINEYFSAFGSSVAEGGTPAGGSPARESILAACPNPFRRTTAVRFALAEGGRVTLEVFDCTGRRIRGLLRGEDTAAGVHETAWDGHDDQGEPVASGIYFLRLGAGSRAATERVLVIR